MLLNNGFIRMTVLNTIITMLIEGSNQDSPGEDNIESLAIFIHLIWFNLSRE